MEFGLGGQIQPHIRYKLLNSCEIVSIRLRRRTETGLYGGEGGITRPLGARPSGRRQSRRSSRLRRSSNRPIEYRGFESTINNP
jgi:hypothetical protein